MSSPTDAETLNVLIGVRTTLQKASKMLSGMRLTFDGSPWGQKDIDAVSKLITAMTPSALERQQEEAVAFSDGGAGSDNQPFCDCHQEYGEGLIAALEWYEEKVRLCRKLHGIPDGEKARHALSSDGGARARKALHSIREDKP